MYNINSNNFFKYASHLKNLNFRFYYAPLNVFVESNEDLRPKHLLDLFYSFLPRSKSANHLEKAVGVLVMQSFVEDEMSLFS